MSNWLPRWLAPRRAPKAGAVRKSSPTRSRKIRVEPLEDRSVPAALLSINDVNLAEGNNGQSDFTFTVTLSEASAQTVTVEYSTAEGTAQNNSDFQRIPNGNQANPTLTFLPGETTKTLNVRVKGDSTEEQDETFFVNLSNAVNATIQDGQGVGTIVNDDSAPVANPDAYAVNEDTALTVNGSGVIANDTDSQNDPLTATVVSGPSHGTLSLNANGSFTYTPAADYNGTDSFTYKVNDGFLDSAVATVTITIDPVNDAPTFTAGADSTVAEDTDAQTVAGWATGISSGPADEAGQALQFIVTTDNPNLFAVAPAVAADGTLTFTPAADANGQATVTVVLKDDGGTANGGADSSPAKTFTVTLTPVNDAPVASDDGYETAEDAELTPGGGLLANDTDVDGDTLTAVLVSGPSHGTLNLNADGSFANYNGTDSFTYQASDGTATSNSATVTITVSPVNDAPVAADQPATTDEDTDVSGQVAASDVDGDSLTYALVSGPAHGSIVLNSDGSFTYTPDADYNGLDSFTFEASDGTATSNTATVSVTVSAVNDAPVAADQPVATDEDTDANGQVAATDVDGDSLTYTLVAGPTHGSLDFNADGTFSYTPDGNYNGPDSFTYEASDGTATSNTATVTLTINPVNDVPVAADQPVTTNEDTDTAGQVAASDVDGDSLTYTLVDGPSHGSLVFNSDGSFSYTPDANYNGTDSFTYLANDGIADSNSATVSLTVNAVNDAPVLAGGGVLAGIPEATSNPAGQTVSGLFGGQFSDIDGDTLAGVVVTGNPQNAEQGSWQYSTDGGTTWFNIGAVGDASALALAANARIRFLPAIGFAGDPAPLVVRAIDSSFTGAFTNGATRATVDVAAAGGTTAFSAATGTVQSPILDATGAWLSNGRVFVTGTAGNDTIVVRPSGDRVLVELNGSVLGNFLRSEVTGKIRMKGLDGNDHLRVSLALPNSSELLGGAGNDVLYGGNSSDLLFGGGGNDRVIGRGGNDILVGGDGNDTLKAGAGSDVMIGGAGADQLYGSLGTDVLIGGFTNFDSDIAALTAIANEWSSVADYATRIAHLKTGPGVLNGTVFLNSTTVHDDGAADVMKGWFDLDWFWSGALDTSRVGEGEVSG
jgi:VCBS repeat-containing protein